MNLSKVQFWILNTMSDGFEPFSMIYQDSLEHIERELSVTEVASELFNLKGMGYVSIVIFSEEDKQLTSEFIAKHYFDLARELSIAKRPFFYSKGEFFFDITDLGKQELEKKEYEKFYAE